MDNRLRGKERDWRKVNEEKVEEEGEVPQAVGNDDASKKQRNSGRRGGNNGGNVLEWSFTLRDRDKAAHVREIGKQELAILNANKREAKEKFDELEVQAQKPGFSPLTLDYHQ